MQMIYVMDLLQAYSPILLIIKDRFFVLPGK